MMNLLIFFSLYFTVPDNNVNILYTASCENQKEYVLTSNNVSDQVSIKEEGNTVFHGGISSDADNSEIRAFYCYENNLYVVIPEANDMGILVNLALYKLVNDNFVYISSINNVLATYATSRDNLLIYYDWNNHYFYKVNLKDDLSDIEQFFHTIDYNSKRIIYSNSLDGIIYTNNDDELIFKNSETEKFLDNNTNCILYDIKEFNNNLYLIYKNYSSNSITIKDENQNDYFDYTLTDDENLENAFIFINELGVYAYLLINDSLRLIYIPAFDKNHANFKEVDTNVYELFKNNDKIFYSKNDANKSDIYLIKADAGIPNMPIVDNSMIGVLSNIPASFKFSNFNQEFVYFLSYKFDIAPNENFSSVYYGDNVTYYNQNSDSQVYLFYNNFVFERDKPYYMRIKYNGIFASSTYNYIRFIITDLGEIVSFKIQDVDTNSTVYTNNEMVKINLEKIGKVDKIQLSENEDFKNNNIDISPINFESEFNFILPEEEKEYTYYIRPVVFDENNLMGWHQIKTAKIILDKTPPTKPEFITENNKEFYKDNVNIRWSQVTDNLSGFKNYKIRLVNALNEELESLVLENNKDNFIPQNNLENGVYTFFISSCDNAKNCSEESKLNFTIIDKENHKPSKPSLIRPKNKDIIDSMPFNISWDKSIDIDNDDVTYSLIIAKDINFDSKESEIYLIHNLSQNIRYLAQGHYYLKLFAIDSKGAESENEIIEFDIIEPKKSSTSSSCSFY